MSIRNFSNDEIEEMSRLLEKRSKESNSAVKMNLKMYMEKHKLHSTEITPIDTWDEFKAIMTLAMEKKERNIYFAKIKRSNIQIHEFMWKTLDENNAGTRTLKIGQFILYYPPTAKIGVSETENIQQQDYDKLLFDFE